jgi:hypothetical protein
MRTAMDPRDARLLRDVVEGGAAPQLVEVLEAALRALQGAPADRRDSWRRDTLKVTAVRVRQTMATLGALRGTPPEVAAMADRFVARLSEELGEAADAGIYAVQVSPSSDEARSAARPAVEFENANVRIAPLAMTTEELLRHERLAEEDAAKTSREIEG